MEKYLRKSLQIIIAIALIISSFAGCVNFPITSNGAETPVGTYGIESPTIWTLYKEYDIECDIFSYESEFDKYNIALVNSENEEYYILRVKDIGFGGMIVFDTSEAASEEYKKMLMGEGTYSLLDCLPGFGGNKIGFSLVRISNQLISATSEAVREILIMVGIQVHDAIPVDTGVQTHYLENDFNFDEAQSYFQKNGYTVYNAKANSLPFDAEVQDKLNYVVAISLDGTTMLGILDYTSDIELKELVAIGMFSYASLSEANGVEYYVAPNGYFLYSAQGMWDEFLETQNAGD